MTTTWPDPAGRVSLLDVDPELAGPVDESERARLRNALVAPVFRFEPGPVPQPPREAMPLGYLMLKGLLLYEATVCGRRAAELLGPGDLFNPGPGADQDVAALPAVRTSTVLTPTLLADLSRLVEPIAFRPGALQALLSRAGNRLEAAAVHRSIGAHVRVDVRVLAYLWHLADRFGVVCRDSIKVDLPLTHATLARLVGARRPTVTTALVHLIELGYVRREGRLFYLLGDASAIEDLDRRSPSHSFALVGSVDGRQPSVVGA